LTTSRSTFASRSAGNSRAGAALRIVRVPPDRAARQAAVTVPAGISCWQTSTSPPAMICSSAGVSPVNVLFAPGATRIEFSPARSTMITATPEAP
jgi:hypothetical protein